MKSTIGIDGLTDKGIFNMNQSDILDFLKKEKPFLMKAYGVKAIGLFGSYAKRNEQPDSDIDILVELTQPKFELLAGLQIYIEKKTGKKIEVIRKQAQQKSHFFELVEKEIIYV